MTLTCHFSSRGPCVGVSTGGPSSDGGEPFSEPGDSLCRTDTQTPTPRGGGETSVSGGPHTGPSPVSGAMGPTGETPGVAPGTVPMIATGGPPPTSHRTGREDRKTTDVLFSPWTSHLPRT